MTNRTPSPTPSEAKGLSDKTRSCNCKEMKKFLDGKTPLGVSIIKVTAVLVSVIVTFLAVHWINARIDEVNGDVVHSRRKRRCVQPFQPVAASKHILTCAISHGRQAELASSGFRNVPRRCSDWTDLEDNAAVPLLDDTGLAGGPSRSPLAHSPRPHVPENEPLL